MFLHTCFKQNLHDFSLNVHFIQYFSSVIISTVRVIACQLYLWWWLSDSFAQSLSYQLFPNHPTLAKNTTTTKERGNQFTLHIPTFHILLLDDKIISLTFCDSSFWNFVSNCHSFVFGAFFASFDQFHIVFKLDLIEIVYISIRFHWFGHFSTSSFATTSTATNVLLRIRYIERRKRKRFPDHFYTEFNEQLFNFNLSVLSRFAILYELTAKWKRSEFISNLFKSEFIFWFVILFIYSFDFNWRLKDNLTLVNVNYNCLSTTSKRATRIIVTGEFFLFCFDLISIENRSKRFDRKMASKRPARLQRFSLPDEQATSVTAPPNLDKKTIITVGETKIEVEPNDLEVKQQLKSFRPMQLQWMMVNIWIDTRVQVIRELGRGAYGIVEHVKHVGSGLEMAVKRITAVSQEQKRLLMDMDVLMQGMACASIVKFYGALYSEGDLWIFMEKMDSSLDKFYKLCYSLSSKTLDDSHLSNDHDELPLPEQVLGKIAANVVKALHYLHSIKVIHRDVKPSNILINRAGDVKLCDFGISGYLVNSVAKTFEAGCKPYMAPERINPDRNRQGYDIRSDVWSLGITMLELSIGKFPYPPANSFFEQLKRVCTDEPPKLPTDRPFSLPYRDFISKWYVLVCFSYFSS